MKRHHHPKHYPANRAAVLQMIKERDHFKRDMGPGLDPHSIAWENAWLWEHVAQLTTALEGYQELIDRMLNNNSRQAG